MFGNYRAIFELPGTRAFSAASFVMRISIAVYPLAIILMFSVDGDYGRAGIFTAAYIVGGAVGLPLLSWFIDRRGQRVVMIPATIVHVAGVAALVLLFKLDVPDPVLAIPVAWVGLTYVAVGSLVRARWSYVLAGRSEVTAAYSLESTIDEVIFVVGPILASVVTVAIDPTAGVIAGAILVLVGMLWLQGQTATEPPLSTQTGPSRSALRYRGMITVTIAMAFLGAVFAGSEVSIAAFAGQHGSRSLTGVLLAAFALGSATAGLLYGSRNWTAPMSQRFVLQAVIFAALVPLFLLAPNVLTLGFIAVVVGFGIAPTLILCFGLVDQLVPPRSLTEGLSWVVTGLNVGYGSSAALVGVVADAHGARASFLLPAGAGILLVIVTVVLRLQLRTYEPEHPALVTPGSA